MSTPTVFLSTASDDLKDWRDILHKAFDRGGCKVHTQGQSLSASAGGVPELLRHHLDKSDFVVHLAGIAYGAEPEQPAFPSHPAFKCSYTQFEYYYAHQQAKQVFAFVCTEDFPYLPFKEKAKDDADRERRRLLQVAHRERVAKGRFDGTPLEGHPKRPLSETIADVSKLLQGVAAALGTIRDCSETCLSDVQKELANLATKRHEELLDYIKDLPSRVADELERRQLIRPSFQLKTDISRIIKYAPAELIGREAETALLHEAWAKVQAHDPKRPHILTFVALGGEGKTSLVAKWAVELAAQDWPGCDAVFAWSFYSQGTRESVAADSDLFLKAALTFFGDDKDKEFAASNVGAHEKAQRLAQLVGERRALLILDGLEPLQHASTATAFKPGELKDQGIAKLLKDLAASSHALCIVTTRIELPDLQAFKGGTVKEVPLLRLSREAGVHLLKKHGVTGSDRRNLPLHDGDAKSELVSEFEKLVEDVDGHALTLHIMGSFLKKAFGGDIRKRDRVTFAKASQKTDNDHAFRAMAAYARWMEDGSDEARRELAILRLMGLFDRPATADCLAAWINPSPSPNGRPASPRPCPKTSAAASPASPRSKPNLPVNFPSPRSHQGRNDEHSRQKLPPLGKAAGHQPQHRAG